MIDELPGGCPVPTGAVARPLEPPPAAQARMAKAQKLADVLARHGATAEDVLSLPEAGWQVASDLAGTTKKHSDETKMLVATLLRMRQGARR